MVSPTFRERSAPRRNAYGILALLSLVVFGLLGTSVLRGDRSPRSFAAAAEALDGEVDFDDLDRVKSFLASKTRASTGDQYLIGVGKADITGPVVEVEFGGYADLSQTGTGLRQRLYSRAFIVGDVSNPDDRFVYLVLDIAAGDTAQRYGILEGLAALGSDYAVYGQSNVAVTGTHSHNGPGAWWNYLLPQISSFGMDPQSLNAIIDGAVLSIQRAHESLTTGYLDVGYVNITDGNLSRSLYAYLNNPQEERDMYNSSTDQTLTMLRFQRASDNLNMGVLTWYPVHGTSMYGNNTHVAGDNKGVAAYLFEQTMASDSSAADGFVAGFSQANVGDTTPNVLGAWCDDGSGEMCSLENSTCSNGLSEDCHGRGPLFANVDLGVTSCYEMGRRQFQGAYDLYSDFDSQATPIVGTTVKSYHFFQNMSYFEFALPNGTLVSTCPAALGQSFAAGTTDWPGAFDFVQGESGEPDDPLWDAVAWALHVPDAQQRACQSPKPILLDVGETTEPYAWTPDIVDVQSFRVGQFIIIVSPSEATTMSGRRWRTAVANEASATFLNSTEPIVVLGGPANTYAHYVATYEEYQIQRYEGASTLYGQYELNAYMNLSVSNLHYLDPTSTSSPPSGPLPPDNRNVSLDFIPGVVYDGNPIGSPYGSVLTQPNASYAIGSVVNVTFQGANPRNNLRLEGTFAAVQQLNGTTWTTVRDDNDWHLVYTWEQTDTLLGYSQVTITWETETTSNSATAPYAEAGTYRVVYNGDAKNVLGTITAFTGTSDSFTLTS
ncbi:Neutral/alkaline nonlysosomal ceramidase [Coniella lustricola]|uniref:Neutral ceramidase n=1 Tax=Coniella lustricola TaxID=2025994 RepID=A0A2T3A1G1_9PEZI|nr:Neutral/alkaline nonlysosomal ceramidase [Coniella lustricola]